jgi:integrase
MARSGARISETIQIKETDIDFTNGTLTIVQPVDVEFDFPRSLYEGF